MQYGIRDATKIIFLTSSDGGATWEPSSEFSALSLDEPMIFGERDAERVVVLTTLDGGATWVPAEPGGLSADPWVAWMPAFGATVTNPHVGDISAVLEGSYQELGSVVTAKAYMKWGAFTGGGGTYGSIGATYGAKPSATYGTLFASTSASVGSGIYTLDLPVNGVANKQPAGLWRARQASTGETAFGPVIITGADEARLAFQDAYPSGVEAFVDDNGLFAWAQGDELWWSFTYEKA